MVDETAVAEEAYVDVPEDIVDEVEDDGVAISRLFVAWISYISSRQPPPQYSKLFPGHSTSQSVNGCTLLPMLGAVPQ